MISPLGAHPSQQLAGRPAAAPLILGYTALVVGVAWLCFVFLFHYMYVSDRNIPRVLLMVSVEIFEQCFLENYLPENVWHQQMGTWASCLAFLKSVT